MVYSTTVVDGELGNGGFNQFFFNGTDRFASTAIAGYEAIGAPKVAAVVAEAMTRVTKLGGKVMESWGDATLQDFAASYQEALFNDLDERFLALYAVEDRHALLVRWMRQHADELISD